MTATDDFDDQGRLKMTIYLPADLVHALDALKVEDQQAPRRTGVTINMTRPPYVVRALQHYVEIRRAGAPPSQRKRPK